MAEPLTVKGGAMLRLPQVIHAWAIMALPFIGTVVAIVGFRASALDVWLLVVTYVLTILGITLGFHRHFTHKAFQAHPAVRAAIGILGSMAAQGSIFYWVGNHRRHHTFADGPGDPHSPYVDEEKELGGWVGFWHAHMGWTFNHELTNTARFAKDLIRDPLVSFINRNYLTWVLLSVALPPVIGGLATMSWRGALTAFLWGSVVRLFLTYHATNSVNSVLHMFGSRPFAADDHAVNNPWLVLPVLGEGWHNNHHAFPDSATFGFEWWQFDPGYLVVLALKKVGLIWDVRKPAPDKIAAKKITAKPSQA